MRVSKAPLLRPSPPPTGPFRTVPSVTKGIVHHFQKSRKKRSPLLRRLPENRGDFVCKRSRAATAQKNAAAKLNSPQCEASSPFFALTNRYADIIVRHPRGTTGRPSDRSVGCGDGSTAASRIIETGCRGCLATRRYRFFSLARLAQEIELYFAAI